MELGLMVEPQAGGSYARLREIARWAEDLGVDAFARSDHYLDQERSAPATDALASFGGLAEATSEIQLVALMTPLTFRHPAIIAKTATTLDEMSDGRFALGIGTGWMVPEHRILGIDLPPLGVRFDRFAEALAYLRAAFGDGDGFSGEFYHLEGVPLLPRPIDLPIVIGGSGMRKTPALAGRFADEYNMFATDADTLTRRRTVMETAAIDAGRNPGSIKISFVGPAPVASTDAAYRELLGEGAARKEMTIPEYEAFLAERNIPRGTPDRAASIISDLSAMGVDRFYLQEYSPLDAVDTGRLADVFTALRG